MYKPWEIGGLGRLGALGDGQIEISLADYFAQYGVNINNGGYDMNLQTAVDAAVQNVAVAEVNRLDALPTLRVTAVRGSLHGTYWTATTVSGATVFILPMYDMGIGFSGGSGDYAWASGIGATGGSWSVDAGDGAWIAESLYSQYKYVGPSLGSAGTPQYVLVSETVPTERYYVKPKDTGGGFGDFMPLLLAAGPLFFTISAIAAGAVAATAAETAVATAVSEAAATEAYVATGGQLVTASEVVTPGAIYSTGGSGITLSTAREALSYGQKAMQVSKLLTGGAAASTMPGASGSSVPRQYQYYGQPQSPVIASGDSNAYSSGQPSSTALWAALSVIISLMKD